MIAAARAGGPLPGAGVLPRTELLTESDAVLFTRDEGINFQFEREGDRVTAVRVMGQRAVRLP